MGVVLGILGLACIVYGVVIMRLHSGSRFFAFWYALGAAMVMAAWFALSGGWEGLPDIAQNVVVCIAFFLLVGFAFTQVLIVRHFGDRGNSNLDYIIVLGAQVYTWGPSVSLKCRLDAACRYLKRNATTTCIVSGGRGSNEHATEASVMAAYLVQGGVAQSRIICEGESKNTWQNIVNSMSFFAADTASVGIVTSDYHLFRSLMTARKAGIANVSGIAAPSKPLYLPNNMVRESFGLIKGFLEGHL